MAIIEAFVGAIGGTFADQWREIIAPGNFDEQVVMVPGVLQNTNNGRGSNYRGSEGVLTNGSKIFVPENTAAFIFNQSGIEDIITEAGGYEYQNGQASLFNRDGARDSLIDQVVSRVAFGGQTSDQKKIAFVNLREIRGIKFGTRGPLVYNDLFYGTDLEIKAFGTFSLRVVDAATFIRNFVPPNVLRYSFSAPQARQQLLSEFIQSFTVAMNSLSSSFRISQLPSQASVIVSQILANEIGAGSWVKRFGLEVDSVGIENIEFTPESRELVKQYSSNLMSLKAFEGATQRASNVSAQQKIAQGIKTHGLGDGGGTVFGMSLAHGMDSQTGSSMETPLMTFDQQIEAVRKMKELLDAGLLSDEEFAVKKREIMRL